MREHSSTDVPDVPAAPSTLGALTERGLPPEHERVTASEGETPGPSSARARAGGSETRLRVVVADNDSDALDLALTDLRLEGHQVWGACDARDAEALIESISPDVVVLDYRMPPGEDGLSLAERLIARPSPPRFVIYSNYQSADLRARATAMGVPFLAKGNLRGLRTAVRGS